MTMRGIRITKQAEKYTKNSDQGARVFHPRRLEE